ncbi:hypothetical protein BHE74_00012902 [Ensete ventricosum]|nr:hypothetical protein BHE74_00012902 [Ensete ventricosum]
MATRRHRRRGRTTLRRRWRRKEGTPCSRSSSWAPPPPSAAPRRAARPLLPVPDTSGSCGRCCCSASTASSSPPPPPPFPVLTPTPRRPLPLHGESFVRDGGGGTFRYQGGDFRDRPPPFVANYENTRGMATRKQGHRPSRGSSSPSIANATAIAKHAIVFDGVFHLKIKPISLPLYLLPVSSSVGPEPIAAVGFLIPAPHERSRDARWGSGALSSREAVVTRVRKPRKTRGRSGRWCCRELDEITGTPRRCVSVLEMLRNKERHAFPRNP